MFGSECAMHSGRITGGLITRAVGDCDPKKGSSKVSICQAQRQNDWRINSWRL